MEEHRTHARVTCNLPSDFKVPASGGDELTFYARVLDISPAGVKLSSAHRIPAGDTIRLSFSLPTLGRPPFRQFRVQVVVTRVVESDGKFELGGRFIGLDPDAEQFILNNHLYQEARKKKDS